jgi:uncharacterized protein (DUF302 family)
MEAELEKRQWVSGGCSQEAGRQVWAEVGQQTLTTLCAHGTWPGRARDANHLIEERGIIEKDRYMPLIKPVFLALALAIAPAAALAADALTVVESKFSVKETADRLAAAIEGKGLKVAARVDHAAGAKTAGLEMPPTEVLMFGNPKLGTPLMLANPQIAIELPMKMVIWQDQAGEVQLGYTAPDALKDRYAIAGKDEAFKTMSGALAAFAKQASGQE